MIWENENLNKKYITFATFIKRELLKFSFVEEFPKASNKTFELIICSANFVDTEPHKNFNKCLVVSVFPDPVSPEIMIDWEFLKIRIFRTILSAVWVVWLNVHCITVTWNSIQRGINFEPLKQYHLQHLPTAKTCGGNTPNETFWYFFIFSNE